MPPQNQNPYPIQPAPAPPSQPGQYDFFLKPPAPQKKSLFAGKSMQQRLLIVAGGAVVLIIAIVIVSSLFKGGGGNTANLIAIAQDQNELARVATEATNQDGLQQTTKNLAQSMALSLTTAQQQLLAYLQQNGHKIGTKQLALTKNAKTDQELTDAAAASNYDTVFDQVMQSGLQSYASALKNAYPTAGPKGKALLQSEYDGAVLLYSQATSAASALGSD